MGKKGFCVIWVTVFNPHPLHLSSGYGRSYLWYPSCCKSKLPSMCSWACQCFMSDVHNVFLHTLLFLSPQDSPLWKLSTAALLVLLYSILLKRTQLPYGSIEAQWEMWKISPLSMSEEEKERWLCKHYCSCWLVYLCAVYKCIDCCLYRIGPSMRQPF